MLLHVLHEGVQRFQQYRGSYAPEIMNYVDISLMKTELVGKVFRFKFCGIRLFSDYLTVGTLR